MGVLLTSGDLAGILNQVKGGKLTRSDSREKFLLAIEPIILAISARHPIYMRDDLKQEVRMMAYEDYDVILDKYLRGDIADLFSFVFKMLSNQAIDYANKQKYIECKLVRLDDVELEPFFYPKTYKKTKLLKKVRKALEAFYAARYSVGSTYSKKASKFAYIFLDGKRPILETNNLAKFFGGNRVLATQAYTTALIVIREVLKQNWSDVECILEGP